VTGPNNKSLFLPVAGLRYYESLDYAGSRGLYWSSSLDESDPGYAYIFHFGSDFYDWGTSNRFLGHSVRAVVR
jgi:hypothetical protein